MPWLNKCPKKLGYHLLSKIELVKLKYNLKTSTFYIKSLSNISADALSRRQIPRCLKNRGKRVQIDMKKNDRILLDPISLWEKHFCTGALKQLLSFGLHIGDTDFAIEACRLNRDALAPSSRSTYSTRVNHLRNFTKKYVKIPFPLENYEPPSYLSFSLVFFAAYLFETDSIRSYNTIRNYMSQVKQVYIFEKGLSRDTVGVSHSKNFEKRN